jgi:basic membrane protein A
MKRLLNLLLIVLLGCSLVFVGCNSTKKTTEGEKNKTEKLKVALLLPGTINDNGWNATAYNGLKMIEKDLGTEIAYTEKVAQSDQEETFRNYISQGFNVLIGHGFEFGDAAKRVAKDNPNVKFLITSTDISQGPNLASINTNPMQMGFLEGVVAGLATKSNILGAVGGMEIPPITLAIQGFEAGVKYINPNAQVFISMTGDFDDAVKAKESAKALIGKGADVVMLDADQAGLGVIEACKEKGVYAVSSIAVQHELAPDTVLGSGISDVPKAMELAVKHVIDGDFKAQFYDVGVKEGVVYLVPNPKFESIYKEKIDQVVSDIKSGKIDVAALAKKK